MVGAGWTGKEMCWRHKPQDYAAIQFHDGDLDDCRWAADLTWTVPPDMPSGAYALHLTCNEGQDHIPFYVLPNRTGPFASVVFLASTFTYQAYANHARGNADAPYKARATSFMRIKPLSSVLKYPASAPMAVNASVLALPERSR